MAVAIASAAAIAVAVGAVVLVTWEGETEPAPVVTVPTVTTTTAPAPQPIEPGPFVPALPGGVASDPIDVTSDVVVAGNVLWVATDAGVVRWNLESGSNRLFAADDALPMSWGLGGGMIATSPDGTVWAATWNKEVAGLSGDSWTRAEGFDQLEVAEQTCSPAAECTNAITAMTVGPDGTLYLAVGRTLVTFDGVTWTETSVAEGVAAPLGAYGWASDMAYGADGTLWGASLDGVVAYRNGAWNRFTTADGVPSGLVTTIAVSPDGDVWVGTRGDVTGTVAGGVGRFDGQAWTTYDVGDGLYSNHVDALAVGNDGTLWAVHSSQAAGDAAGERAPGWLSRFDGSQWTVARIENVGVGFGQGGAVVDSTATLWVGGRFGVVGFDGSQVQGLRVEGDTRPVIDVPHAIVEGGTDVLATTVARPAPPAATCPDGTSPEKPGPFDQDRPATDYLSSAAFDRQSGRMVLVSGDYTPRTTWSFDVCTNTWQQMSSPLGVATRLVYDADSDLVVAFDSAGRAVVTYDIESDRWDIVGRWPEELRGLPAAVYDPVSGLIVVRDTSNSQMWAYDVDRDMWSAVDQGTLAPPPVGNGPDDGGTQVMVYDPDADRLVLYVGDNVSAFGPWEGAGLDVTWTFDLRTGVWSLEDTVTPELGWLLVHAVHDEAKRLSVFPDDGFVVGYDATAGEWDLLWRHEGPTIDMGLGLGVLNRHWAWVVYDPINARVLAGGGQARMSEGAQMWVGMDDVWAFESETGTWTEVVAATTR